MMKKTMRGALILFAILMSSAFADASTSQGEMLSAYDAANDGLYIQADVGEGEGNWRANFPEVAFFSNSQWGFVYGGAVGYQWTRFLAAEAGGFLLQPARFQVNYRDWYVRAWSTDIAGKLMWPIPRMTSLAPFVKAGIAYRDTKIDGFSPIFANFVPLLAAGLQYNATTNFYMDLQWAYLGAGSNVALNNTRPNSIPAYNIFTLGIGYKFTFS